MTQAGSAGDALAQIAIVVIGRNEGERLRRCLASVAHVPIRIYVDSGSVDGSVAMARAAGVEVVELTAPPGFTAARGRNAGIAHLVAHRPGIGFVQVVDGDCEVQPGWLEAGMAALGARPELAAVFGRRRERFPRASIYNGFCDDEWNVPVGEAPAFGGDVLFRLAALRSAGGYTETMIAGEDPDLALRLRGGGWRIERIAAEMTLHDAAMLRFAQWWRRASRAGHAFAELAERHPGSRWPDWRRSCRSIAAWGAAMPLLTLATLALSLIHRPIWLLAALALAGLWLAKAARIARDKRRAGLAPRLALASGIFLMLGKLPEMQGLACFHLDRLAGRRARLIEYKGAGD